MSDEIRSFVSVPRPSVSILQAQKIAGVSRRTIYNWMGADKVEYVRTAGGSCRIYVDTLFTAGNVRPPPPPAAREISE